MAEVYAPLIVSRLFMNNEVC